MFWGQNSPQTWFLGAWIGILSQICEIFELRYLEKYALDQHEILRTISGAQMDFVGGPALQNYKMAAAAILDFCTNINNSAADWRRWMKFCSDVDGCHRKWIVWPKWTKIINSRWRRSPFWISSITHNSFSIAYICTKFGKCIALEILHAGMPKYWTKIKCKMAAAAILDFCTNINNSAADWRR